MEQKLRYEYTYFLHIFKVKNYEKYLLSLIKNKNIEKTKFEKEKDLDLYSYFTPKMKTILFADFISNDEENYPDKKKAKLYSELNCVHFEYKNVHNIQAKIGKENGIFFEIDKMQIICFNTGICFLAIKTHIEDADDFLKLLDFNYKFKEINLSTNYLKDYENIKIQTNSFESTESFGNLVSELTMNYTKEKPMYIYSYACINSENWKTEYDFENIKGNYTKFINGKNSADNTTLQYKENVYGAEYVKVGLSTSAFGIVTSSKENYNFTKLPYEFERQYLYTLIWELYKKEYLLHKSKINEEMQIQVTEDKLGNKIVKAVESEFEINKKIKQVNQQQDINNSEKLEKLNKILIMLLAFSLTFNIINLLLIIRMFLG